MFSGTLTTARTNKTVYAPGESVTVTVVGQVSYTPEAGSPGSGFGLGEQWYSGIRVVDGDSIVMESKYNPYYRSPLTKTDTHNVNASLKFTIPVNPEYVKVELWAGLASVISGSTGMTFCADQLLALNISGQTPLPNPTPNPGSGLPEGATEIVIGSMRSDGIFSYNGAAIDYLGNRMTINSISYWLITHAVSPNIMHDDPEAWMAAILPLRAPVTWSDYQAGGDGAGGGYGTPTPIPNPTPAPGTTTYTCPVDGKVFNSLAAYQSHYQSAHSTPAPSPTPSTNPKTGGNIPTAFQDSNTGLYFNAQADLDAFLAAHKDNSGGFDFEKYKWPIVAGAGVLLVLAFTGRKD